MEKVRKTGKKVRSIVIVSAGISLVFVGLACHRPPVSTPTVTDAGDA